MVEALSTAGRSSYAPYSQCPASIVLKLRDGRLISGNSIESVAFNPTIGPMQAALVNLLALGADYADISEAWLALHLAGSVNYTSSTSEFLTAIAPHVVLKTLAWER